MQLRNLKRAFLAHKGLRLYIQRSGNKISYGELNILIAFTLGGGKSHGLSKTYIYKFLKATFNTLDWAETSRGIDRLVAIQFLNCHSAPRSHKYSLSVYGQNEISALEKILRTQRCDRLKF